MKARRKVSLGQNSIRALLDKYGEQLICVRYRYDEERQIRHKTVELIAETIAWIPQPEKIRSDALVGVKVELEEVKLQKQIRQADGKWNRQPRLWKSDTTRRSHLNFKAGSNHLPCLIIARCIAGLKVVRLRGTCDDDVRAHMPRCPDRLSRDRNVRLPKLCDSTRMARAAHHHLTDLIRATHLCAS